MRKAGIKPKSEVSEQRVIRRKGERKRKKERERERERRRAREKKTKSRDEWVHVAVPEGANTCCLVDTAAHQRQSS